MYAFDYNGKTYTTMNLQKKLKRLRIPESNITNVREIEDSSKRKYSIEDNTIDEWYETVDKYHVIHPDGRISVCYWSKDKPNEPSALELLKSHMWNEKTKTGVKGYTEEYLKTLPKPIKQISI